MNKQESVWDYPRPPRLEATPRRLRILHAGRTVADTTQGLRILETSHPPVYYLPQSALDMTVISRSSTRQTFCEFKGLATYWTLMLPGLTLPDIAWSYERPTAAYAGLAHHLAFYCRPQLECWVDEEQVVPQPGDFYGGWITSDLRGPFKGPPGTRGW